MPEASRVISSALQAAQADAVLQVEACPECEARQGLCAAHRASVLPQIAKPSWVRLMGLSLVQQQRLQSREQREASVAAKKAQRAREKTAARRTARAKQLREAFGV